MTVYVNNRPVVLPHEDMTVADFAAWKNIPAGGSAIAINNALITRLKWTSVYLRDEDKITVMSAAFGG